LKNNSIPKPVAGRISIHAIVKTLLLAVVFLHTHEALSQEIRMDAARSIDEGSSASDSEGIVEAPPVEVGAGGELQLQRKHRTQMIDRFEWHTHLLWESRYVTEGRDNLSGESLVSVSSEFVIDEIYFIPWFAYSPGTDYTELDLNFVYGTLLAEDFLAYVGYQHNRSHYLDERAVDNEVSIDLAYKLINHVGLFSGIYYSFVENGSFIEIGVKYFGDLDTAIHYSMQATLGANAGYVSDGHHGLNHAQLRSNLSFNPLMNLEVFGYAGYNRAIERDEIRYSGDEALDDFFWAGIGLNYLF
jgi:hypothetical protein